MTVIADPKQFGKFVALVNSARWWVVLVTNKQVLSKQVRNNNPAHSLVDN